jgi:zinc/manganese transport system permease protein
VPELLTYQFVQLAILCVLVLAGIHAYLGYHVVSRGVIFVDLSLAQVAALGGVIAFCIGVHEGTASYLVSLLFTFAGAFLISIARTRDERVPQEAFIGIIYAGSTAISVLLLAHHPEGAEMIQHMIAGSLLTVSPGELAKIAVLYSALGLFFWIFRRRFELISTDRAAAAARGWNLLLWDFLFYAAFAVVVTSSVSIAGVLLVFSLLVIPPVTALLATTRLPARLALGWGVGGAGALGGVTAAVLLDLPAGPAVMTVLVALLVFAALFGTRRGRR